MLIIIEPERIKLPLAMQTEITNAVADAIGLYKYDIHRYWKFYDALNTFIEQNYIHELKHYWGKDFEHNWTIVNEEIPALLSKYRRLERLDQPSSYQLMVRYERELLKNVRLLKTALVIAYNNSELKDKPLPQQKIDILQDIRNKHKAKEYLKKENQTNITK